MVEPPVFGVPPLEAGAAWAAGLAASAGLAGSAGLLVGAGACWHAATSDAAPARLSVAADFRKPLRVRRLTSGVMALPPILYAPAASSIDARPRHFEASPVYAGRQRMAPRGVRDGEGLLRRGQNGVRRDRRGVPFGHQSAVRLDLIATSLVVPTQRLPHHVGGDVEAVQAEAGGEPDRRASQQHVRERGRALVERRVRRLGPDRRAVLAEGG